MHLPDTASGGYTNFNRYYFAQIDKDGAVIDERFNGGGSAADYIVDALKKPVLSYWAAREGMDATTPAGVLQGPKVMIINEFAGSGGDLMPWMFRRMKVGPLVGQADVGRAGRHRRLPDARGRRLRHRAALRLLQPREPVGGGEPRRGARTSRWTSTRPQWRKGRDTQLEKAVEVAMAELKKNPPKKVARPPYPNYHKKN